MTNTYNNRLRTALSLAQPTKSWTNAFYYDAAKRLTNVTSQAGSFTYTLGGSSAASALLKKLALPNTSYRTNNYDTVARLLFTKLNNSSHTTLNSHTYAYNPGNQRTQQVFSAGSTYNYTHDKIGQLKVADSATASEDRGYTYDSAWNLNYRTNNGSLDAFTVDSKNQLTTVAADTYYYGGNGNLTNYNHPYPFYYEYDDEHSPLALHRRLTKYDQRKIRNTYLKDVLTRLPNMTNKQIPEVTPQAWAKTHRTLQRQATS